MAIDPNDLIIFKVREQQKKKVEAKPIKKPEVKVEKRPEPKAIPAPAPIVQQKPKAERKPLFFNKPRERVEAPERQPIAPIQFTKPRQAEQPKRAERQPEYQPQTSPESIADMQVYKSEDDMAEALINKNATQTREEYMSREAVQNLHCTWHPWRKAYSRCNYCHRPFCFEDIAEYNGNYYCLEDVDKAPSYSGAKERYSTYNNLSVAAGAMMLAMFAVFIVFANGQLGYIIGYANAVGIFQFLGNINYSYITALAEGLFAALGVIAAMLLFIQSVRGYSVALLCVFANVALASYQYLNSGTVYLAAVAGMGFVAIILLAYSRNNYESAPTTQYYPAEGQEYDLSMPNVGQF